MAVIWKDKEGSVGVGTVRDFIRGPFSEYPDTVIKQADVEKKLDREDNPYEKRDREISLLREEFFRLAGAKETDEIEMDFNEETGAFLEITQEDPPVAEKGWWVWEGEETDILFFDGERIGDFSTSCRGGMYFVEAHVREERYKATEATEGKFRQ